MSGSLLIRFNNGFVFPEPETPFINIRYGWSGVSGYFELWSFMFSFEM